MRARERARNSYIRNHEHPPGGTHMAGYELITTASCPRTAVFRDRGNRPRGTIDDRQPRRPAPITQTAKPVARREPGSGASGSGPILMINSSHALTLAVEGF